jgi:SOS-response transcriptional repressor LexA
VTGTGESQIYRDLIRFKPSELTPNAWAIKAGVSRTVWADMRRHGNPSRRTLEKLLTAAGSSLAEFEALRIVPQTRPLAGGTAFSDRRLEWAPANLPPLPLVASRLAGEWGQPNGQLELTEICHDELIDRVPRPMSLAADPDAFALTIVGDAMSPRFRPGTRVAVSPRAAVAIGDDVVVRLRPAPEWASHNGEPVLINRLVRRSTAQVELRQFNPDLIAQVDAADIEGILKIPGELI